MKTTNFIYLFLVVLMATLFSCSSETSPLLETPDPITINDTIYRDSLTIHPYDYRNFSFSSTPNQDLFSDIKAGTFYYTSFYDTATSKNYFLEIFININKSQLRIRVFENSATYEKVQTFKYELKEKVKTKIISDSIIADIDTNTIKFTTDTWDLSNSNDTIYLSLYNNICGKLILQNVEKDKFFLGQLETDNGFSRKIIFINYSWISILFGKNPYYIVGELPNMWNVWYSQRFLELNAINNIFVNNSSSFLQYFD